MKTRQTKYHEKILKTGLVRRSYYHRPEDAEKIKAFIKTLQTPSK